MPKYTKRLGLVKVTLCKLERFFGNIFRFLCQHFDDRCRTVGGNYDTNNPDITAAQSYNLKPLKNKANSHTSFFINGK